MLDKTSSPATELQMGLETRRIWWSVGESQEVKMKACHLSRSLHARRRPSPRQLEAAGMVHANLSPENILILGQRAVIGGLGDVCLLAAEDVELGLASVADFEGSRGFVSSVMLQPPEARARAQHPESPVLGIESGSSRRTVRLLRRRAL